MDGYSVNEAAAVLGIPEGRVWELLARGVLSGSAEVGGDMRVFLRETAVSEAPKRDGNGNGGHGGNGEITPFRELLTEFRNLTERYGQALLALGEARGEVAALRGRMDLLEARLNHRLPWSEAPTAWTPAPEAPAESTTDEADTIPAADVSSPLESPPESPAGADPDPEPVSEAPVAEPVADQDEDFVADILGATLGSPPDSTLAEPTPAEPTPADPTPADPTSPDDTELPSKPRSAHRATSREALAGFAEALARAQDPATADVAADFSELPGSQKTAEAVAAYRREAEPESATDSGPDAGESLPEPSVEAAAELEPTQEGEVILEPPASIVRPGYSTDTPEPDWIAEEDLIISAGEDASVRADELAHQAATLAESEREVVDPAISEHEDAWPEIPKAEAVTADARTEKMLAEPDATSADDVAALASDDVVEPEVFEAEPPVIAVAEPELTAAEQVDEAAASASETKGEPTAESRLAPVEIAAEPPASDDVALLIGPEPFSEPPIVPHEPAFWESGASGRAPFAIAQPDPWEASPVRTMPIEVKSPVPAAPPIAPAAASTEASTAEAAPAPAPLAAASGPAPKPVEPEPASGPPALSPAAQAGRAAAARRRPPQGPAARAIRRLRLLLD